MHIAGYELDNSFKINHLSFGKKENFDRITGMFPGAGIEHPLDGFEATKPEGKEKMKCGFFVKAVPAVFVGDAITRILSGVEVIVGRIIETLDFGCKKPFLTSSLYVNHFLFNFLNRSELASNARLFKVIHSHGGLLAQGFERKRFQSPRSHHHGQL